MSTPPTSERPNQTTRASDAPPTRPLFQGETVGRPELVFGLVGALGNNLVLVDRALRDALLTVSYSATSVRVSSLIMDAYNLNHQSSVPRPVTQLDELMDRGDDLRRAVAHGAAAAALAIMSISDARHDALGEQFRSSEDGPQERESHATILRSLKRPEEVHLLRSVYGPRFTLIGAWAPREEREKEIGDRLRRHHPGKDSEWYVEQVARLLRRDERDALETRHGQRVRDTFELADAYIALRPGQPIDEALRRLVRLLFGEPFSTPTWEEQAMHQAAGARLRSSASGRQVGAVVVDADGELLVTGTNEAPKAGGGQYWVGDRPDNRDFRYGFDINDRQKLAIITDILRLLQTAGGWLKDDLRQKDVDELARQSLAHGGPLESSRVSDLLEFGRIAHAEMAAICTAARRGTPLRNTTMFATTYPCHQCARLIIATGIQRVIYVDPYPKSLVPDMYRHEIAEAASSCSDRVILEPFEGIAPRLYRSVFTMPNRNRDRVTGDFLDWDPSLAPPRRMADAEATHPLQSLEDGVAAEMEDALRSAGWLPEETVPSTDGTAQAGPSS